MNTEAPNNLDEAIAQVGILIGDHGKKKAKTMAEDDFLAFSHHALGRYLRNGWGLWGETALAKWFNGLGIKHADDMSAIILTSFHRWLTGKDRDLEGQINYYKVYWESHKADKDLYKSMLQGTWETHDPTKVKP